MIAQIIIATCGLATVWLSQCRTLAARRWAAPIGIIAQPAWLYAAWQAEQWGIAALSIVYAVGWMRGIHTHWIKP